MWFRPSWSINRSACRCTSVCARASNKGYAKVREDFIITEKAPTRVSTSVKHSFLNVKALVGTFNQGKALVGAFSVIVKTDGWCAALVLARSQPLPLITHGPVECDNAAWPHVTSHIIMAHTAHIHHNTAATQSYIQYFESLRPGKKDSLIRNTKHILIKC